MTNFYRFELIVEISQEEVYNYCEVSNKGNGDALLEITDTMYLGLSCIDGMLNRQYEIDGADSYVHSVTNEDGDEV